MGHETRRTAESAQGIRPQAFEGDENDRAVVGWPAAGGEDKKDNDDGKDTGAASPPVSSKSWQSLESLVFFAVRQTGP
jgi:hypothetical protein